jgi:hypothetical protein
MLIRIDSGNLPYVKVSGGLGLTDCSRPQTYRIGYSSGSTANRAFLPVPKYTFPDPYRYTYNRYTQKGIGGI